ncbi:CoA-binding domain protein [Magnetococcus marinus MC-1]|uniref:CoA-binding domain protein n=1 Tax=Magnetococcus marinus (strain ATCC BAA-1437 / JCM 17883 / MC-1) TaxID=156889 RepID=A0L6M3_MAGMM|nr:acetate--CoA ligase [Magnetococcus marinus]ABK43616.1 CoA-binding domain protein [Magnetococcus marinus MC-1]
MHDNLDAIFNPQSIAVVGASNRPGSVGHAIFSNLLGTFQGVIYPVNPRNMAVLGVRAYPSVAELPETVDLVVVVVPTAQVAAVVDEAGQRGVRGAIVITAGFKEVGGEGLEHENHLKAVVAKHGMALVGPNCLGVINAHNSVRMNASFATKSPSAGNIAFISQSGALCTAVLDYAMGRNIGFSKFISFGNKADVTECDLLEYLKDDPDTDAILMYLEDVSDGRRFIETARRVAWESKKPMLAIKSGTSAEGKKAATSHTGALAGSEAAYDAIFLQSGIQRVETISELFEYAQGFSQQPLPKGNRIAIVTNAGGPGIMATDALERHGLQLATLSDATKSRLKAKLPPTANINNPVDVIGDAHHDRYEAALDLVLADEGVDGVVVILTPQAMTDVLETAQIVPRASSRGKPVLCAFMGVMDVQEGVAYLRNHGIPNYEFPEAAVRAMAAMSRFSERLHYQRRHAAPQFDVDLGKVQQLIEGFLGEADSRLLHQAEAGQIMAAYGLPVLKNGLATSLEDLERVLDEVGLPVAMKISSPDIVHKSDAGGVMIKLKTREAAREAFTTIVANAKAYDANARITGVYVEQMAKKGVEVILGSSRDPKFGPLVMFGLGGVMVEVFKDVTFRLAPMWEISAERMVQEVKAYKILQGVRGNPASDVESIREAILRVSQMLTDNPQIQELDINPMIVHAEGLGSAVADCRMVIERRR